MNDTNFERAGEAHPTTMTTQTKTPPLSAAHYRVGMEVELDFSIRGRNRFTASGTQNDRVIIEIAHPETGDTVDCLFDPQHLRPVLRPLTAVTNAEWQAYWPGCEVLSRGKYDVEISKAYDSLMTIWDDGEIHCTSLFNPADLIDYLDSLSVDVRNWLPTGTAVSKTTPTP